MCCSVTLSKVRVISFVYRVIKSYVFKVRDCSLNNLASKAQVRYLIVSGLPVCALFLQLFQLDHNFQKDVNEHKILDSMVSKTYHSNSD